MQLNIYTPSQVLLEAEVSKMIAESQHGTFCIKPHHIDCLVSLVPGILSYETLTGDELFIAVDEGVLIKCDQEIRISTRHAIQGSSLDQLKRQVEQEFLNLDEQERRTQSALAKLEASLARYFTAS